MNACSLFRRARPRLCTTALAVAVAMAGTGMAQEDNKTLRVFIFAGQSNMVGSDSKAEDIKRFPMFRGLDEPQPKVRFHYCIGRENKKQSDGWVKLQPVNGVVGPELSFARRVRSHIKAPIAIIKCAAGGTHLGGDWNPEDPSGFKMYPLALKRIREALKSLERKKIRYRLEGFMWHQGENDMFNQGFKVSYGRNLMSFIKRLRRDLKTPTLRFYIGELCAKTIWGMDNRANMYAISQGQREVTNKDPLADYVPTSHVGVKIGGGVGLHYHYGTLGQLQHGEGYAEAYLKSIDKAAKPARILHKLPYKAGQPVQLFILAGHRNMEGERGFIQDLRTLGSQRSLIKDNPRIPYRYSVGGGFRVSDDWEPLGPIGYYDTFGPELSFAARLKRKLKSNIAIAKFTHSGSQVYDWSPGGTPAPSRDLYKSFITFIAEAKQDLESKGFEVELSGIFYHLGENDTAWGPSRQKLAKRLSTLISESRKDLSTPKLPWFVSQQEPVAHESVAKFDVLSAVAEQSQKGKHFTHVKAFGLPGREQQLVLTAAGIVELGELLASTYLRARE